MGLARGGGGAGGGVRARSWWYARAVVAMFVVFMVLAVLAPHLGPPFEEALLLTLHLVLLLTRQDPPLPLVINLVLNVGHLAPLFLMLSPLLGQNLPRVLLLRLDLRRLVGRHLASGS